MVMINRLNKIVKCVCMDDITAKDAAKTFYNHVWKNHGLFIFIIFDRGRPFVNHFWEQLITSYKHQQIFPKFTTQKFMVKRK